MSGAVAFPANSPVFSSSPRVSPIFCKPPSSFSRSSTLSPSQSPLSPFNLLFQKHPINVINCNRNSTENTVDPLVFSQPSATILKRKRPMKIDIPIAPLNLESIAYENEERLNEVEVDAEGYAVYCKRGRKRGAMEDRYSAAIALPGDSKQGIFGVFDGHGGFKAAEYAAKNLNKNIMNELARSDERIEEAVKEGYLITDTELLKEDINGGTCCVTALIRQGNLVVSNSGDCRAVMSRGGIAEALTVDHRPSRQDERERIESLGGYVDSCHGVWRVQGTLAVSRGIGDRQLKQWVIAEPDTEILRIEPDCEFLILASDGLWDKVGNQEAVDVVRPLCMGVDKSDRYTACRKLVDLSIQRGSTDDVSVMIIQLSHFVPFLGN